MAQPTAKRPTQQERERLRKLVMDRGGDRFTLAVLNFALSRKQLEDRIAKRAERQDRKAVQQQRVIVVKDGGPNDSNQVIDSGDGKTAYVIRRGARKLGLEGMVMGNSWTESAGSQSATAPSNRASTKAGMSTTPGMGAIQTDTAAQPQHVSHLTSDHDLLLDLFHEEALRRFKELADINIASGSASISSLPAQRIFREVHLRTNNSVTDPKHERGGLTL